MHERPNRLRYFRRLHDLTQEELAERAGLHPQTVSDLERGRYRPTVETAASLSRVLNCSVEDLFVPSGSGATPDDSDGDAGLPGASATATAPASGTVVSDRTQSEPAVAHSDDEVEDPA